MAIIKLAEGRYALRWKDAKGQRHYEALDPMPYEQVKREHAKRWADRERERSSRATVAGLCRTYLDEHDVYARHPFSPAGRERAESIAKMIAADPLGVVIPGVLSSALFVKHVMLWRARGSKEVSAGTLDREFNGLRAAINHALRTGELTTDPLPKGAVPRLTPSMGGHTVYFQPEQWRAFYSALDDEKVWQAYVEKVRTFGPMKIGATIDTPRRYGAGRRPDSDSTSDYRKRLLGFKPLWLALLHTGSRLSEIRLLTWENVDLRNGYMTIYMGKSRKPKVLPIADDLRADIESRQRGIGQAYVYARPDGRAYNRKQCEDAFHVYRKVAGLPDNLTIHKIRHTAGSWMAINGRGVKEIQEVLGHSNVTQTMRYVHLAPVHLKGAVSAIATMSETETENHDRNPDKVSGKEE